MSISRIVNSYDEWSQLEEVIVGSVDGFPGFHLDNSFNLFYWDNIKPFLASKNYFRNHAGQSDWPIIKIEQQIIDELQEDIAGLVSAIEKLGVKVRRPVSIVGNTNIQTPFWNSIQSPPLNVRDQTLILGSTIIETAPHVRARIFENDYLKPLFYEYMLAGARWLSMPRPTLCAGSLDLGFFELSAEEDQALQDSRTVCLPQLNQELVFDGAQCIRLGKDVLVNIGNRNHILGFEWLKHTMGDKFDFHPLDRMADSHIDSMILPLRPGLWLIRHKGVLDYLPQKFHSWDYIIAPEAKKDLFPSYQGKNLAIASRFIDMNVLSINERTVLVNSLFPEMIKTLEKNRFVVIPIRHRHRRLFGGGFHCFTLDIRRTGELESYA